MAIKNIDSLVNPLFDLPVYHQEWFFTPHAGKKRVFRISKTKVAKVPYDWEWLSSEELMKSAIGRLEDECRITQEAYDRSISVPKPEGIFYAAYRNIARPSTLYKPAIYPAFIMEYVQGRTVDKIIGNKPISEIKKMKDGVIMLQFFTEELKKAAESGFLPYDTHRGNALWDCNKKKGYLIDLEKWQKKEKKEV